MSTVRTEIVMWFPLPSRRYFDAVLDPSKPIAFCAILKSKWRTNGAPNLRHFKKPLKENGASAPLLHLAPRVAHKWRNTSPVGEVSEPKPRPGLSLEEELLVTRDALANRADELADLDATLAPVRAEERSVRNSIVGTHSTANGRIIFNHGNLINRAPLFARLMEISVEWGPLKARRAAVNTHVKSLERDIERLRKLMEPKKPRRAL